MTIELMSALIRERSPPHSPFLLVCHNGFPYFSFNSFTNSAQCDCLHRWPSSWSQLGHSFLLLTSLLSVQCWDSPSSSIVAPQQLLHTTQLIFDGVSSGANWARFLDSITHCSELGKMIKAFLQWELFGKLTLQRALWAHKIVFTQTPHYKQLYELFCKLTSLIHTYI